MEIDAKTKSVLDMYTKYPFPSYSNHHNIFSRFVYPAIRELSDFKRILDAGCGTGECSLDMASKFPQSEIIGIDITEKSLALARKRALTQDMTNLRFEQANLIDYRPDLGQFDFVHSQGVVHILSDPQTNLKNIPNIKDRQKKKNSLE